MHKVYVEPKQRWAFWVLASVHMAEAPEDVFSCVLVEDETVLAKEAMRSGWIRLSWAGATEPDKPDEVTGETAFLSPAGQALCGIDIEGLELPPPVRRSDPRRRGDDRRPPRRGSGASNGNAARAGSGRSGGGPRPEGSSSPAGAPKSGDAAPNAGAEVKDNARPADGERRRRRRRRGPRRPPGESGGGGGDAGGSRPRGPSSGG